MSWQPSNRTSRRLGDRTLKFPTQEQGAWHTPSPQHACLTCEMAQGRYCRSQPHECWASFLWHAEEVQLSNVSRVPTLCPLLSPRWTYRANVQSYAPSLRELPFRWGHRPCVPKCSWAPAHQADQFPDKMPFVPMGERTLHLQGVLCFC